MQAQGERQVLVAQSAAKEMKMQEWYASANKAHSEQLILKWS